MKETIENLEKEKKEIQERLNKINKAINVLQDVCKHEKDNGKSAFEFEGNDSHYDYEKCIICSKSIKV